MTMQRLMVPILCLFFSTPLLGETRKTSADEARKLVYALLKPSGCTERTCDVETISDKYFTQFLFFEALALHSSPNSSLHIGSWAVDPRTGDLYDASVCAEYRNAAVHSLQQQLRKRIGLSEGDYRKLKQRPPMCDPGENVELRTGKY